MLLTQQRVVVPVKDYPPRHFSAAELGFLDRAPALKKWRLSARYAAKKAMEKAVKELKLPTFKSLQDLELVSESSGQVRLKCQDPLAATLLKKGIKIHVSLSHEKDWATAFVVLDHSL